MEVWPEAWNGEDTTRLVSDRALFHGIAALLSETAPRLSNWPNDVLIALRNETMSQAMWELRHERLLDEIFTAFSAKHIEAIVLKGTALAYSLYPRPYARRRGDSDVLVRRAELNEARDVLAALGFSLVLHTHGPFGDMQFQDLWRLELSDDTVHDIDLHWKVTNSQALECVLGVDECFAGSILLPRLSVHAKSLDPVRRLLLSCINRGLDKSGGYYAIDRFHYEEDRLIWACDIDLEASAFSVRDWQGFSKLVVERGVAAICLDGLLFAAEALGTEIPEDVVNDLARVSPDTWPCRYIANSNDWLRTWEDFRATPSVADKIRFLLARAFPSLRFIRNKYPQSSRWPVLALYFRRLINAMPKLIRRNPE